MENECIKWVSEAREVFPKLNRMVILADYKKMNHKRLGYVQTKIEQKIDFDPESLLLGNSNKIKKRRLKPKEFKIFINQDLQKIKNSALRKEVVQHILIHELLHIESEDLITLSKDYNLRKKKKIHVSDFKEEVFKKYNQLRELRGIMQIQKREHLQIAIQKILESINWHKR
jgi:hypothetical protein